MNQKKNWIVRVYDLENNVLSEWTIEGRTQQEAESEAETIAHNTNGYDDWTLTEVSEKSMA